MPRKVKKSIIKSERENKLLNSAITKFSKAVISEIPILSLFKESLAFVYSTSKQLFFEDFIFGIGIELGQENTDTAITKLTKKINDKTFSEIISNILDTLVFSKSYKSRVILGIIAAKYISSDEIDYEDMILISALKDIYDLELKAFIEFTCISDFSENDNTKFLYDFTNTQRIIMEKLKNLSVVGNDLAHSRFGGEKDYLSFQLTTVSNRLSEYLQKIKN